jgi:hypothetical protein
MVVREVAAGLALAVGTGPALAETAAAKTRAKGSQAGAENVRVENRAQALRLIDRPDQRLAGEAMVISLQRDAAGNFSPIGLRASTASARKLQSTDEGGPVARAACPVCIPGAIFISVAARAATARLIGAAATSAAAKAATTAAARAALPLIARGPLGTFPKLVFDGAKLQQKFKHAKDFAGYNPILKNMKVSDPGAHITFEAAVRTHMLDRYTHRIFGTVSGIKHPVAHFYNPNTKLVAVFRVDQGGGVGRFVTAYKADPKRAAMLERQGHLGLRMPF